MIAQVRTVIQNLCLRIRVWGLALLSLLFTVWGILVYQFGILGLPFRNVCGWNHCALALCYSILTGWILYFFTSVLPHIRNKIVRHTYIESELSGLVVELSMFIEKLILDKKDKSEVNIDTIRIASQDIIPFWSMLTLLNAINWNTSIQLTSMPKTKHANANDKPVLITAREQAEYILCKIIATVNSILSIHWNYLTDAQLRNLKTISDMELEVNPVFGRFGRFGDLGDRVTLVNTINRIVRPLQQSIGIKAPSSSKISNRRNNMNDGSL